MLIQPNKSILLVLYHNERQMTADLNELTSTTMAITCGEYIDKNSLITFINPYFKGQGIISAITFTKPIFIYTLEIAHIQFKPGILINQRI